MGTDFASILRRPPGTPAEATRPEAPKECSSALFTAEGGAPEGTGIAEVPPSPILSGEALQLLQDTDPLKLTDQDIDNIVAHNREHLRRLAEGSMKKGVRPRAKIKEAADPTAKKKAAPRKKRATGGQEADGGPGTPSGQEGGPEAS